MSILHLFNFSDLLHNSFI